MKSQTNIQLVFVVEEGFVNVWSETNVSIILKQINIVSVLRFLHTKSEKRHSPNGVCLGSKEILSLAL